MLDDEIEELTKLLIKEQFKGEQTIIKMTKKDLIKFCINLIKFIKEVEENEQFTKNDV